MDKVFRPERRAITLPRVLLFSGTLAGLLMFYITRDPIGPVTIYFIATWVFVSSELYTIRISDEGIQKYYLGVQFWRARFSRIYAEIGSLQPFGMFRAIHLINKKSGRTVRTIPLEVYSDEDIDSIITSLRIVGALREF